LGYFWGEIQDSLIFLSLAPLMGMLDIKSLSTSELKGWTESISHKPFRADQIQNWLFKGLVDSFDVMENVPVDLRDKLKYHFRIQSLEESNRLESTDGTIKFAFKTHDGHFIETVLIPARERFSVCVSTQIGCAMGCTFCRTATMGFIRNLETGEILEQIIRVKRLLAEQGADVTNIIFMGMGEPLQNLDNVHRACVTLHERKHLNMGAKRLTISTSGVVPKIFELIERETPCHLAVSLNGTNDEMRSKIMPVNRRWPMAELLGACDAYTQKTGNEVTFEYVMIQGITCTPQAAKELLKITQQRSCKVNAILINASENPAHLPPTQKEVDEFLDIVRAGEVKITMRTPRGRDILAACGQLAIKQKKVASC
jgi:23S rRNA (adenine2503-C2)-methyltransferase